MCGGHGRSGRPAGLTPLLPPRWSLIALLLAVVCGSASAEEPPEDEDEDGPELHGEVKVTDRRAAQDAADLQHTHPASVVAIDLDERVSPVTTLADLLDDVAGVHVRRFGGPGDPSFVTVRGSSARQVEVFVDGVPLNSQGSTAVDLSELPLDSYDRVEIYRGFSPAALGAAPMGGVVQLTSKPGSAVSPRMQATLGSWWTRKLVMRAGAAQQFTGGALADLRLDATYNGTRGDFRYFDDNATIYSLRDDRTRRRANNRNDRFTLDARARLEVGSLRLSLTDSFGWSQGGEPGDGHGATSRSRSGSITNLLAGQGRLRIDPQAELYARLSYRYRLDTLEDPLGEIGYGVQDLRQRNSELIGGIYGELRPLPWIAILPGIQARYESFRERDLRAEDPDASPLQQRVATTLSLEGDLQPWDGKLSVLAGLSVFLNDNRFVADGPVGSGGSVKGNQVFASGAMPRVALAVRPFPWMTARASIARSWRAPGFGELFGDGASVVGNPQLRPETRGNLDASVRLRGPRSAPVGGALEFGGFYGEAQDLIVLRTIPAYSKPLNVRDLRLSGLELAASARALGVVDGSFALTWTDSEIRQGELPAHEGKRVPGVPEWQLDAQISLGWKQLVRVSWQLQFTAGTYDSQTNLFLQPPRALHDLRLRVQPGPRWPWFSVELLNLTDQRIAVLYRDPLNPAEDDRRVVPVQDFRSAPLPGRSVFLTIGWTLEKRQSARIPVPAASTQE